MTLPDPVHEAARGVVEAVNVSPAWDAGAVSFVLVEAIARLRAALSAERVLTPITDEIRAADLEISVERRPPGMQPVKVYSGVRIKHLPTGLIAFCGTEKSQLRNKEIALIMLRAALDAALNGGE